MPRFLDGRRASRDQPRGILADTCCAKGVEAQAAKLRLRNRAAPSAVTDEPALAAPQPSIRGNDRSQMKCRSIKPPRMISSRLGAPVWRWRGGFFPRQSGIFPSQRRGEPAALVAIGQMLARAWTRRKETAESRGDASLQRRASMHCQRGCRRSRTGRSQPEIAVSDRAKLGGLTQFLPRRGPQFISNSLNIEVIVSVTTKNARVCDNPLKFTRKSLILNGKMSEWSSAFAALPLRRDISPWLATQSARAVAAQWFISETVLIGVP